MTLSKAIVTSRLDRPVKYYESIGSTNDAAKAWLEAGAPDRAAVVANAQSRGRGRKGRAWQTPPDAALALSVILRPQRHLVPQVNFLGALAVCDLAAEAGCSMIGIKWPNDVQVNGKKIAGILPEVVWEGPEALGVVLGIGLNVRIDFSRSELADTATSLESIVNRRLDRADLLQSLLGHVDGWYSHINEEILFRSWKSRLNMLGARIEVEDLVGRAADVLPDGSLLLRDSFGALHTVEAGDVFVVKEGGAGA
ncbi:MAG: biotin--[acetyl-CoA-carboxylase] ligase [Chloroflexi bacterium]|nr:biotin--[acetyl-CoA-carboxylase] ligase [Chloroflexota bacterium]